MPGQRNPPFRIRLLSRRKRVRLPVYGENVRRILIAIEQGSLIPVVVGQLQKLQAERSEAEMASQRFLIASHGEVDLDLVARTFRDLSCNCRPAFGGGTTIKGRGFVGRCEGKGLVDRERE